MTYFLNGSLTYDYKLQQGFLAFDCKKHIICFQDTFFQYLFYWWCLLTFIFLYVLLDHWSFGHLVSKTEVKLFVNYVTSAVSLRIAIFLKNKPKCPKSCYEIKYITADGTNDSNAMNFVSYIAGQIRTYSYGQHAFWEILQMTLITPMA